MFVQSGLTIDHTAENRLSYEYLFAINYVDTSLRWLTGNSGSVNRIPSLFCIILLYRTDTSCKIVGLACSFFFLSWLITLDTLELHEHTSVAQQFKHPVILTMVHHFEETVSVSILNSFLCLMTCNELLALSLHFFNLRLCWLFCLRTSWASGLKRHRILCLHLLQFCAEGSQYRCKICDALALESQTTGKTFCHFIVCQLYHNNILGRFMTEVTRTLWTTTTTEIGTWA